MVGCWNDVFRVVVVNVDMNFGWGIGLGGMIWWVGGVVWGSVEVGEILGFWVVIYFIGDLRVNDWRGGVWMNGDDEFKVICEGMCIG